MQEQKIPTPGTKIGRYQLDELIGSGASGAVFLAHDDLLDTKVGLKLLHPAVAHHPELLERFKREVLLARRISHPGVCRLFDLHLEEGFSFLSMEYVDGETLRDVIAASGPMAPDRACRIVRGICEALGAAHAVGVVHRDLKPRNIMIRPGDEVCVLDFGIATAMDVTGLTRPGVPLGTRYYIAPEVWQGEAATHLADIFAIGIIFYNCLTAGMPWAAAQGQTLLQAMLDGKRPVLPSQVNPKIPRRIDNILFKTIALDPAERFQSVDDVIAAIDAAMSDDDSGDWSEATFETRPEVALKTARDPSNAGPSTDDVSVQLANVGLPTMDPAVHISDIGLSPFESQEETAEGGPVRQLTTKVPGDTDEKVAPLSGSDPTSAGGPAVDDVLDDEADKETLPPSSVKGLSKKAPSSSEVRPAMKVKQTRPVPEPISIPPEPAVSESAASENAATEEVTIPRSFMEGRGLSEDASWVVGGVAQPSLGATDAPEKQPSNQESFYDDFEPVEMTVVRADGKVTSTSSGGLGKVMFGALALALIVGGGWWVSNRQLEDGLGDGADNGAALAADDENTGAEDRLEPKPAQAEAAEGEPAPASDGLAVAAEGTNPDDGAAVGESAAVDDGAAVEGAAVGEGAAVDEGAGAGETDALVAEAVEDNAEDAAALAEEPEPKTAHKATRKKRRRKPRRRKTVAQRRAKSRSTRKAEPAPVVEAKPRVAAALAKKEGPSPEQAAEARSTWQQAMKSLSRAEQRRGFRRGDLPLVDHKRRQIKKLARANDYARAASLAYEAVKSVEAASIDKAFVQLKLKRFNARFDKVSDPVVKKRIAPMMGQVLKRSASGDYEGANRWLNQAFQSLGQ